ncbi:hypothetical protein QLX08_011051 [Tetragonisca angustula]|uniref:Uncharacterized protein n=1 Tax=Tetragonisca angustula TaxID=166442 RepID=A0AAW0Z9T4_9HYME
MDYIPLLLSYNGYSGYEENFLHCTVTSPTMNVDNTLCRRVLLLLWFCDFGAQGRNWEMFIFVPNLAMCVQLNECSECNETYSQTEF